VTKHLYRIEVRKEFVKSCRFALPTHNCPSCLAWTQESPSKKAWSYNVATRFILLDQVRDFKLPVEKEELNASPRHGACPLTRVFESNPEEVLPSAVHFCADFLDGARYYFLENSERCTLWPCRTFQHYTVFSDTQQPSGLLHQHIALDS
jgi:hypothetical protein